MQTTVTVPPEAYPTSLETNNMKITYAVMVRVARSEYNFLPRILHNAFSPVPVDRVPSRVGVTFVGLILRTEPSLIHSI